MSYPQSTAYTVLIKVFLASDHVTEATGKTLAVKISKAGGAFANPSAGAVNATELGNGWYYYVLSATDTNTIGDLIVRLTEASCDTAERILPIVSATTGGATNLDALVSSRLATAGYTVPPTAVAIRQEMDTNSTKLAAAATETNATSNKNTILAAIPAAATIAAACEAAMLNEGDATALLAAIAAKVEQFLINDGDATATIAAIATACNAAIVAGEVGTDAATAAAQATAANTKAGTLLTDVAAIPTSNPSVSDIAAGLLVDGATNKLKVNADHTVNTIVDVDAEAIADAVVEALTASGVTVDPDSTDAIAAAVASALGTARVTVVSPVSQDGGTVTLTRGDDYFNADQRPVPFTIEGAFASWAGATAILRLTSPGFATDVEGTILDTTGSSRRVRFDVPAEVTSQLKPSARGTFQVAIALSNEHITTPVHDGRLIVVAKAGAA